ncbi:MAG: alpha/beta hydrolase [Pseudomonadota bacterium]
MARCLAREARTRITDEVSAMPLTHDILAPPRAAGADGSLLRQRSSVWLHGAGLSGATWAGMTADLPLARCPDLLGQGSTALLDPPRVEAVADALQPDLPPDAILIGHSLGGMVALELAARPACGIAALVLVESVPTLRDTISGRVSTALATPMIRALGPRGLAWLSGLGQSPETRAHLKAELSRQSTASLLAALEAAGDYDGRPALSRVTVPTLVVVGRANRSTHDGARDAAGAIPGAEFVMLAGGHMLQTDNPAELRRTIDAFLAARLGRSGGCR